jgi:outer membrane protein
MKKVIILISVLCFFCLSVIEAQINKGRLQIGVSTSFSYINYGSDLMNLGFTTITSKSNNYGGALRFAGKVFTLNLLPKVGYFVIDNFALGLNTCIASSSENQVTVKHITTSLGLGPFARYYIPGSKVMPFFEINSLFGFINIKDKYQSYSTSVKTGMMSIGGGVGIAVKLVDKVTFDMMIGYNSMSLKVFESNDLDEKTVEGTIGIKLGFIVFLGSN